MSLGVDAHAEDEILKFERVSPLASANVVPKAVSRDDAEVLAKRLIQARESSSAQMIQSVRDSLAPLPLPRPAVPVLEFEKLGDVKEIVSDVRPLPITQGATTNASAPHIRQMSGLSGAAIDRSLPAEIIGPSGQSMPTDRQLRDIFLRVVEAAAGRSPSVARALAERSASEADVAEARGQRYPQVDIGARSQMVEFGSNSRGSSGEPSLSLDVRTPIFDWGRIRKTIDARSQLASAADWGFEAELESSAFDVTSNLVELGKQRIIVDISQQYVDRMSDLVKMLEGIVAVDTGRISELTQARARLLQAEASRSTADTRARDIEINLRRMVGDRPLPTLPTSRYWDIRLPELKWLLAEAVNHPVMRQAQAQASSADLQADVMKSSSLPQLNWVVGKVTGEDSFGREPAWQTGLTVS
ncbi:TolC family protein [Stenotrophomonas humi]|uniref:TolC family protein n=1 Tax=Stenotrophomonas humi TaxID=405444 RepID=UPI00137951AA|nr:TolC family protein [Stenotrophomonas humi]